MAKRITLATVGTKAHYSETNLSTNFQRLNNNYDNYLHINGTGESGNTMLGDLDMGAKKVTNIGAPSSSGDAATKAYVDALAITVAAGTTVNTELADTDQDTGIQTEATADLDRLDLFAAVSGGSANGIEIHGDDSAASALTNPYVKVLKHVHLNTDVRIGDAQAADTYLELSDTSEPNVIIFVANSASMLKLDGPNTVIEAYQNMYFGTVAKGITDIDGDTKIQLEETSDDDIIRFDAATVEALQIRSTYLRPQVDIRMYDNGATAAGKKVGDEDNDTYIQFNQATGGTDDDTIRFYAGGVETARITSLGMTLMSAGTSWAMQLADFVGQSSVPAAASTDRGKMFAVENDRYVTQVGSGDDSVDLFVMDQTDLISRPGQGYVVLADQDHDWSALEAPLVPFTVYINPTTTRTIILFTNQTAPGFPIRIVNLATTAGLNIIVNSSGGNRVWVVCPGNQCEIVSAVKAPTTAANWRVTNPGWPIHARVHKSADQNNVTENIATKVTFDTVLVDPAGMFVMAFDRLVLPVAGWWEIRGSVSLIASAANDFGFEVGAYLNGAETAGGGASKFYVSGGTATPRAAIPVLGKVQCSTPGTDYVELYTSYTEGTATDSGDILANGAFAALNNNKATYLEISWIGP